MYSSNGPCWLSRSYGTAVALALQHVCAAYKPTRCCCCCCCWPLAACCSQIPIPPPTPSLQTSPCTISVLDPHRCLLTAVIRKYVIRSRIRMVPTPGPASRSCNFAAARRHSERRSGTSNLLECILQQLREVGPSSAHRNFTTVEAYALRQQQPPAPRFHHSCSPHCLVRAAPLPVLLLLPDDQPERSLQRRCLFRRRQVQSPVRGSGVVGEEAGVVEARTPTPRRL